MGSYQLIQLGLECLGVALPLMIVLLTPSKSNVDDAKIRRLTKWLVLTTIPAVAMVAIANYAWPGMTPPHTFLVFMPLWFGFVLRIVMAKRPQGGLAACPKCNYPIAEEMRDDEVICPECGKRSRPDQLFLKRDVCG